jgi:PAS domain S-box-containing protein
VKIGNINIDMSAVRSARLSNLSGFARGLGLGFWGLIASLFGLFLLQYYNFLLFHTVAELYSIIVASCVFILAWKSQRFLENGYLLFVGISLLFVGAIDLVHTLAYRGMGVFPERDANLPTQLWIAARYLQAFSMLAALYFIKRRMNSLQVLAAFSLVTALLIGAIYFTDIFPDSYIEGAGLTLFKRVSEYIIAGLFAGTAVLLYRQRKGMHPDVLVLLILSLVASTISELAFSDYVSVYGFANMFGHLLKIVAFYFIYKAIIETGFERPYDLLFHQLKLREEQLQKSEARLRRLVDSNIIGVHFTDRAGSIQEPNEAFLAMIGYTPEEFQEAGLTWRDITPAPYQHLDDNAVIEALQSKNGACTPFEKEFLRKDGSRCPVLVGFALLDSPAHNFVSFAIDISARKQAEASTLLYARQLERANQELKDFAFIASHDLQEPLRKIQAFSERITMKYGSEMEEEGRDYLTRMTSAAVRLQKMIQDLLEYSRISTKGKSFEQVDLKEIAADVISDLEMAIERVNGQVLLEDLPVVEADPIQMHQLLQNLVANGLKFHRPGVPPQVHIRGLEAKNGGANGIQLLVSDNGIGFDDRFIDRIFMPFHRLVGHSEYEGSGIGLAICRKIVERHSGEITATSQKGVGTTFTIHLPLRQTEINKSIDRRGEGDELGRVEAF